MSNWQMKIIPQKAFIENEKVLKRTRNYSKGVLTDKLQTKTVSMEVNNHGEVHEKKKWEEYLFEFFDVVTW